MVEQCKSNMVSKCALSFEKGALRAHSLYPFCMTDEAIRTGAASLLAAVATIAVPEPQQE